VDVIAQGIVDAYREMQIEVPVVVRLAGMNVADGERILADAKLHLVRALGLGEAARKAVEAAGS